MRLSPHRRIILVVLAASTFLALSGCGDEKIIAVGGGPPPDAGFDATADTGAPGADGPETSQPPVDTGPGPVAGEGREIVLLHDTSAPTQVTITQNLLIQAKVVDYAQSGPAAGVPVFYEIIENDGGGDATLTTAQAYTDDSGVVGVTFRANLVSNVHYKVQLSADQAQPVALEIFVVDTPKGDIEVELNYEGPISVKNVHVRLFEGGYTCGQFNAVNVPEGPLGEKTLLGIGAGSSVEFKDLPEAKKFTVVATAQSPSGSLAAAGCLDGIVVLPEQSNKVTLTMYLLVLNPAGFYDAVTVFDFTGAIPGQVGDIIDEVVLLFNDPGKFLINQVKNLVSAYIGDLITDVAFSLFEDELADIITDWMLNESPDWLQNIFTVGQDLTQVINNLELRADLLISKLSNDYYVQGVMYWDSIVLYWKLGCAEEGEPGYDPTCGQYIFGLEDFASTEFPMDIIEGKFTGFIHDFDKLDIDNFPIKINYGKIILFVLNEMLLPAITGENNLTDAILSFVNCGSIASFFSNGVLDAIGVSEGDIEEFCIDGVTLITKPISLILGNLALDSQMRLSGKAVMVDDDNDLKVDHIIDGEFSGTIEVDGQEGPQFKGTWDAHKQ